MEVGQDVVHTGGGGSKARSRNSVRNNLHWTNTRGSGTVGVTVVNIQGLRKGDRILGGRA